MHPKQKQEICYIESIEEEEIADVINHAAVNIDVPCWNILSNEKEANASDEEYLGVVWLYFWEMGPCWSYRWWWAPQEDVS